MWLVAMGMHARSYLRGAKLQQVALSRHQRPF
jgi:hypothetical protein